MAAVAQLAVAFVARTRQAVSGINRVRRSLLGYEKSAKKSSFATKLLNGAMVRLGAVAGGVAVIGGLRRIVTTTEDFNRAMNRSTAIMGDLTDTMRNRLRAAAIETARSTIFSNREAAESFFFLASAGLNARESLRALPIVARFAQAGMFDMARATDLATDAQSAIGLTVKDTAKNLRNLRRVTDVLVKANTLANASVEQFSEALTNKAGARARQLNVTIEDTVAVLAALADQGVKAAEAGTKFDIVLRDLTFKAVENADAFRKFGVEVFRLGEFRRPQAIIRDLERAMRGLTDAEEVALLTTLGFTQKSVSALQQLIGTAEKIDAFSRQLQQAGGTASEVARKNVTPLQEAIAELSGSFALIEKKASGTTAFVANRMKDTARSIDIITKVGNRRQVDFLMPEVPQEVLSRIAREQAAAADSMSNRIRDARRIHEDFIKSSRNDLSAFVRSNEAATMSVEQIRQALNDLRVSPALMAIKGFGSEIATAWAEGFRDAAKAARESGDLIIQQFKTPLERFRDTFREIMGLFQRGGLTASETRSLLGRLSQEVRASAVQVTSVPLGFAQTFNPASFSPRGLQRLNVEQRVRDPQLKQTNRLLQDIDRTLANRTFTAVTQ